MREPVTTSSWMVLDPAAASAAQALPATASPASRVVDIMTVLIVEFAPTCASVCHLGARQRRNPAQTICVACRLRYEILKILRTSKA
jgi:hypothetical protein